MQVGVAMVALLAFAALVTDYGVLWAARRQAQNAADAAALAGAISLEHNPDFDVARASAKAVGESNKIFGLAPTINLGSGDSVDETEDISFPLCPPGEGAGEKACIRVNVYRNESRDAPPDVLWPPVRHDAAGCQGDGDRADRVGQLGQVSAAVCRRRPLVGRLRRQQGQHLFPRPTPSQGPSGGPRTTPISLTLPMGAPVARATRISRRTGTIPRRTVGPSSTTTDVS